ncbi:MULTISPECIES: hypothetical protein [unclassified Variovorax]|uniref:hypothetical protein n=1 Tax=unclassified Variovorax TaxID=663243 RepID=UPI0008D83E3C|nr:MULTISPECIES: hypothetical protein [unclassified Variovorax]SEK08857.1 hypothetical protein SAMN05518853_108212 [Variovorax sp. OK202]SFD59028.1 hypothetical protein SAMN05444746_108212 [Variovorax sp. OK212]
MTDLLSPKEKLALSRAALLAAMGYRTVESETGSQVVRLARERGHNAVGSGAGMEERVERSVLGRWWRRSHLSTIAELGTPFLQDYASRHPKKLMAYAAGTGSLIVLVKPWRLLSVGMVVGLLVRSTNLAGVLTDFLVPQLGDTEGPRDDFLDRPPG